MTGLADLFAAHRFDKGIGRCHCGAEMGGRGHRTAEHRAHLAAVITDWFARRLGEDDVKWAVSDAIYRARQARVINDTCPEGPDADAALAAVRTAIVGGTS